MQSQLVLQSFRAQFKTPTFPDPIAAITLTVTTSSRGPSTKVKVPLKSEHLELWLPTHCSLHLFTLCKNYAKYILLYSPLSISVQLVLGSTSSRRRTGFSGVSSPLEIGRSHLSIQCGLKTNHQIQQTASAPPMRLCIEDTAQRHQERIPSQHGIPLRELRAVQFGLWGL